MKNSAIRKYQAMKYAADYAVMHSRKFRKKASSAQRADADYGDEEINKYLLTQLKGIQKQVRIMRKILSRPPPRYENSEGHEVLNWRQHENRDL